MKKLALTLLFTLSSSLFALENAELEWTEKTKKSYWKTQDQLIIGENEDKKNSVLWTKNNFKDYELVVKFKTDSKDYDSGVFLRGGSHQVQIGVSRSLKKDLTACIYAPIDKKGKYPASSDQVKELHKLGEWNEMKITVKGKNIQVSLNGTRTVNYDAVKIKESGPIGLQLHAGVHQKMEFEIVSFKEL
jgi:arylsulfatase A